MINSKKAMKLAKIFSFVLFVTICCQTVPATADTCYSSTQKCSDKETSETCTSKYGGIAKEKLGKKLQRLGNMNFENNFKFLLMSTYIGNYVKNREGFEKLYHQMSSAAWNHGQDVVKYLTMRGRSFDIQFIKNNEDGSCFAELMKTSAEKNCQFEIIGLGCALDMMKETTLVAREAHLMASGKDSYDPDVTSYLEKQFINPYTEKIRQLSGFANEMVQKCQDCVTLGIDPKLSVFVIDEYLSEILE